MGDIRVIPLGAGQDVGRSCILVGIGNKNIMLDCGMHMGYNNEKRFPDFSYITKNQDVDKYLDAVLISHFHLDHCGALPYLTEMIGYNGPIYMSHPTKAISPILLEDFRKITVDKRSDSNFFTKDMITKCMKKVRTVHLHQLIKVDDELEIQAYYAGHVLGAVMFYVRVGKQSILYTGDFNMTPDRHLGAAKIKPNLEPNLLITESTYATTIRDSKRDREHDFLTKVHNVLLGGGKVLIPVFALGRAQELCILLEIFWTRLNLTYPIYFTAGLGNKANEYYKLFIEWTNQQIKETFVDRNMFDFKIIKPLPQGYDFSSDQPMVVLASPGMLHAGQSLNIFKKLAPIEKNMVLIPGYCVAGTVGHKIQQGVKKLELDNKQTVIDVRLQVEYLSFSAHADAYGIIKLIDQCKPRNVMLVHGESLKMDFLKSRIEQRFNINCYKPANGELQLINCTDRIYCVADEQYLNQLQQIQQDALLQGLHTRHRKKAMKTALIVDRENDQIEMMDPNKALEKTGMVEHHIHFSSTVKFESNYLMSDIMNKLVAYLKSIFKPKSYDEIHCLDEKIVIGHSIDEPIVTILVKESSISSSDIASDNIGGSNSSYLNSQGQRVFDVVKLMESINDQGAVGGGPGGLANHGSYGNGTDDQLGSREVSLQVTYSYPHESLGSRLFVVIQRTCNERLLDFIC